jgi:hypothetical protein
MFRRIRFALALGLIGALLLTSVGSAAAGGRKVFDSSLAAIPTGGLVLDGVTGGGVPWSIDEGRATLTADGRLHVEVQGLVVTASGVNPSPTGRAAVVCAGAVVAMTDAVPFSTAGDAEVDAQVDVASPCLDLAVLFLNGAGTRWFAVTGF